MPTQKTFKGRVRTRMTKTGESYTAARQQLLRKGAGPELAASEASAATVSTPVDYPTSDEAARTATGRGYEEWFALLDAWGAAERRHPEIARWLVAEYGADGWWSQSITVGYERARGMRARYETTGGFSVSVTRTIAVDEDRLLAAFTDSSIRRRWLPDATMRRRPTTAARTARFDWADPTSRVVVGIIPKGPARATVAVQHERLPDAEAADRERAAWRDRLAALKATLEGTQPIGR